MRRTVLLGCMAGLIGLFMVILSASSPIHAKEGRTQGQATFDPARVQQTLNAIIYPRLTLTALGVVARTSTALANLTVTQNDLNTQTEIAMFEHMTLAVMEQTYTSTPTPTATQSLTATATLSATPTVSLTPTLSATPINATDQYATILANAYSRLTGTIAVQQTNAAQETLQAIIALTLQLTPTPVISPTTLNATDQFNTIAAVAYARLTATIAAQQTNAAQRTIEAIIGGTLQYTPTPSVTPTPGASDMRNTLEAQVGVSLSQTPIVALTQTAGAEFNATVQSIVGGNQTATSAAIRGTLTANVTPITAKNVTQLSVARTIVQPDSRLPGSIAFNGVGHQFAYIEGKSVVVWDILADAKIREWGGLSDRVSIAFSSDGLRVAAASLDGTVRLYDVINNLELPALQAHIGGALHVAFSPDGKLLASTGVDRIVRIWNAQNGVPLRALSTKDVRQELTTVAFDPSGKRVFAANREGRLVAWEVSSNAQIYSVRVPIQLTDIAFSPDGNFIAVGGISTIVSVLQVDNGAVVSNITLPFNQTTALAFSVDNGILFVGGSSDRIAAYALVSGKPLTTIRGHTGLITDIAVSPDGTRLVSTSDDGTVRIWSTLIVAPTVTPTVTNTARNAIPTNTKKPGIPSTAPAPGASPQP